jgi:Fe-S cluster assembly scaffold protein SufB
MRYDTALNFEPEREQDFLESVSEEEIIYLWRSIKGHGLSEDQAWQAIVTGIALDIAFAKPKAVRQIEH